MFFLSLSEWTLKNVILRIVLALALGSVIGIDRGAKKRGGGARMDAAVCLGAATVMLTSQYMYLTFPGSVNLSRMAAQVISGIGFLGAGSIIVSGHQIKGLTSAASIWTCACIGLAVGIGFADGALLITGIQLAVLHLLPVIEKLFYQWSRYVTLYIESDRKRTAAMLLHKLRSDGCTVDMYDVEKSRAEGQSVTILITVRIPARLKKEEYLKELERLEGVLFVDAI